MGKFSLTNAVAKTAERVGVRLALVVTISIIGEAAIFCHFDNDFGILNGCRHFSPKHVSFVHRLSRPSNVVTPEQIAIGGVYATTVIVCRYRGGEDSMHDAVSTTYSTATQLNRN